MLKNSLIAFLLANSVTFEHRAALLWFIFCDESNKCIWWSALYIGFTGFMKCLSQLFFLHLKRFLYVDQIL